MSKSTSLELEMKKYNLLHNLEKHNNYINNVRKKPHTVKKDLAEYIRSNYDTMDETEMKIIAMKCLDVNEIKKTLLFYELKNYKRAPSTIMTLEKFKIHAVNIFNRYQCKAGGFCIEDNEWMVYDKSCIKYDVSENELLFENTICVVDNDDIETDIFITYLIKQLNHVATNIYTEFRQKQEHKSKVIKLLIWATDTNQVISDDGTIGL